MPSPYYEHGRRDAEQGTFNQLFYHTYHDYKRGYDDVMKGPVRRRRVPIIALAVTLLAASSAVGWLLRDRGVFTAAATPITIVVTATPVTPTPTFPFTIATPLPPTPTTPADLALRIGGKATVATEGGTLRVRPDPSTQREPLAALPNGSTVTLVGGPESGDTYTWWQIELADRTGWVVADFLRPIP